MNWAIVMAGGRGTRFWPESRNRRPKPFLKLLGPRTLLEETVERLSPLFPPSRTVVVIQEELVPQARRLLKRIPPGNILGEPMGKNTAPCCVYAASQIARRDPEAKLVFLPADQSIRPKRLFLKTLRTALTIVDERPVLLGIRPDSPQTGYGYLEVNRFARRVKGLSHFTIRRFHEKPSLKRARQFLRRGNFLWNGGTFVWQIDSFKKAVRAHLPRLAKAWKLLGEQPLSRARLKRIYQGLPSLSLDYGVMEKMRNLHCLLAHFEWRDLGGWLGLAASWPSDAQKNRVQGKALLVKSRRNLVKGDERLVALLGVEDLLVVDTSDALLICPRSQTEEIRELVRALERRKAFQYL